LLIYLGIALWRRVRTGPALLVLDLLFLALLVFPADFTRVRVMGLTDFRLADFLGRPGEMACLAAVLGLVIWKHRLAARTLAVSIVVTFPVVLLVMAKTGLVCLNLITLPRCLCSVPLAPPLHVPDNQPRVVWIIFDETDYRLAFEKRPANVPLPEFDRLRHESLAAEHAYPPGDSTIISMPALITGRRLLQVREDGCDLDLTLAQSGATEKWSARAGRQYGPGGMVSPLWADAGGEPELLLEAPVPVL